MKRKMIIGLALGVATMAVIAAVPASRGGQDVLRLARETRPHLVNARLDTRSAGTDLQAVFRSMVAREAGPAWFGYAVPAVPGHHRVCDNCGFGLWDRTYLEGRRVDTTVNIPDRKVSLEADRVAMLLFRVEAGRIQKIRVFSPECELDGGDLPFFWLTDVNPADSVALLLPLVKPSTERRDSNEPSESTIMMAVAIHADSSASLALERFVAAGQPQSVRKNAAFWLGASRGRAGFETLRSLIEHEADSAFRKDLVFPISLSQEREALRLLIRLAREDQNTEVRRQALFWIAQKAGSEVVSTIVDAVSNDPETSVKTQAVYALSRLPRNEGVPLLIDVARTHRNPEVRKRAMYWLGQSHDPRAVAFFEEVLKVR